MSCKNVFAVLQVSPEHVALVAHSVPSDVAVGLPQGLDENWQVVDLESVHEQPDGVLVEFVSLDEAVSYQSYWQQRGAVVRPTVH